MKELDAMNVSLGGRNIVEAGAGTGKTYSIQTLVARLVVEKGVPCEKICIVTFTREATAELLRRLREILEDVEELCRRTEMTPGESSDEKRAFEIVEHAIKMGVDKDIVTARVHQAVTDFDTMRISTIHGFCFRILSEFAVESRVRMALVLKENSRDMLKKCFEDFCRNELYSAQNDRKLSFLWRQFKFSPDLLLEKLEGVCVSDVEPFYGVKDEPDLKSSIAIRALKVYQILQICESDLRLDCNDGPLLDLYTNIKHLIAMDPDANPYEIINFVDNRLARAEIVPGALLGLWCELKFFHARVLAGARDFVRKEFARKTEEEGMVDNNLVLSLLRDRITDSEYGDRLVSALAERFDAIFVDEFQDTDPVQLDIFTAICNKFSSGQVSFFIGDPKQAIYAFRGGDINCYLKGFREVNEENRYTLSVNRRSGKKLIDAVNEFYLSLNTPFAVPEIGYIRAGCSQVNDRIFFADRRGELPAMSFFPRSYDDIAAEISSLLADEKCRIFIEREGGEEPRRLRPSDFAVLVRSNQDCVPVAEALHAYGIPTMVYNAENSLTAAEIQDFADFLRAILHPADFSLWKKVLSGIYFRKTAAEIAVYAEADNCADIEQNLLLNTIWHEHSLEAMFLAADSHYRISQRLFQQNGGKRLWILTRKWLDLAAKLEEKENLSPEMLLIRFLREMDPEQCSFGEDEYSIQLQDDEDSVKILTIHKSKGLQFPVVYVYDMSLEISSKKSLLFHNKDKNFMDLSPGGDAECFYTAENIAELLRLAYVAVTRAQVMFRGGIKKQRIKSASFVNYVRRNPELSCDSWHKELKMVLASKKKPEYDPFVFSGLDIIPAVQNFWRGTTEKALECRIWKSPVLVSGWSKTSFSALTVSAYSGDTVYADETADDYVEDEIREVNPGKTLFDRIAAFPAGAVTGNAWHEIMANLPFNSNDERIYRCVSDKLAAYSLLCDDNGENKAEDIAAMIKELLNTPLPGEYGGFTLAEIPEQDTVAELEFTVAAHVETALADICRNLPEYGMKSPSGNKHCATVITGAMDLVFRHRGKFFLADWKSNRLGYGTAAYSQEAVAEVMRKKYYILQGLIYLVMLKKYLQWDKNAYENKFGGIYYFFLRGCVPSVPGHGIWVHKPAWEILERIEKVLTGYEC